MFPFLVWYLLTTLIGWLAFPLLYRLLVPLPGRGYGLARPAGLLLWGYLFWIGGSLGLWQNDFGGMFFALLLLALISLGIFFVGENDVAGSWPERARRSLSNLLAWAWVQRRTLATAEAVFLFSFAFLALTRAANPDLVGTEKPMELAFINAILRSPSLPPHDPWLSGYAISYYYFGYLLTAMLARLSGVWGSVAHNLMTALTFALAAQAAYALLFDLLPLRLGEERRFLHLLALLAPFSLLILSNWEGLLEVLHAAGIFWTDPPSAFNFWRWLDLRDLNQPPQLPLSWLPRRYWWWWRASRVIQDYTLQGAPQEIIDEFPFFSFLLGDLHPHVLNIPYTLLGMGVALSLYLGNTDRERFPWLPLPFFGLLALLLGGLAFLNTWDVLIIALLLGAAFLLRRLRSYGWDWIRLEEGILFLMSLAISALLLYLPFFLSFSSQARGVLPNLVNPTRGAHLWVMFGPLFLPLLFYLWKEKPSWKDSKVAWMWGMAGGLLILSLLFLASWGIAILVGNFAPQLKQAFLTSQGVPDGWTLFRAALMRRLTYGFSALTLLALLSLALVHLIRALLSSVRHLPSEISQAQIFVSLLLGLGALWALIPEFFFLGDQFGWRMNTVFKFYYQAWIFLSLVTAYALSVLWAERRLRRWEQGFIIVALLAGLVYPILGWWDRIGGIASFRELSLDDFRRLERFQPAEAQAIRYLQVAPFGIVAEAVGGSYTEYGRIATYTGLPDVLNWPGHEVQWRGSAAPQGTREADIRLLYETTSWEEAQQIIERYHIRYIYIGGLERITYRLREEKFERHLRPLFRQEGVVIYGVY